MAEILLQRTWATQVVPVYLVIRREMPTPERMAAAGEERVAEVIRPLGLAWRARLLARLAETLRDGWGDSVPGDMRDLLELPGVGPYAASAFLSFHRGTRATLLDSNIVRLYGRLYGVATGPESRRQRRLRDLAELLTPARTHTSHNYAMLDLCRLVCTPAPKCPECPLRLSCRFGRAQV